MQRPTRPRARRTRLGNCERVLSFPHLVDVIEITVRAISLHFSPQPDEAVFAGGKSPRSWLLAQPCYCCLFLRWLWFSSVFVVVFLGKSVESRKMARFPGRSAARNAWRTAALGAAAQPGSMKKLLIAFAPVYRYGGWRQDRGTPPLQLLLHKRLSTNKYR